MAEGQPPPGPAGPAARLVPGEGRAVRHPPARPRSAPHSLVPDNISAANRLIGEVVQSRRRPLLGPSPG